MPNIGILEISRKMNKILKNAEMQPDPPSLANIQGWPSEWIYPRCGNTGFARIMDDPVNLPGSADLAAFPRF